MKPNTTKKAERTRVIFKQEGKEVIAFFPEEPGTRNPYNCSCYERVGQHSSADVGYAAALKPAKEFAELKKELEMMGYLLCVGKKFTRAALEKRRAMCN